MSTIERCALCGCTLHRTAGTYALPTVQGRSHATEHHCVAERFFGRSKTRSGLRDRTFEACPWGVEGATLVFCYECHEELLHNPVFLPSDIERLSRLCHDRGLGEEVKSDSRVGLAGRIKLLHQVIDAGLSALTASSGAPPLLGASPAEESSKFAPSRVAVLPSPLAPLSARIREWPLPKPGVYILMGEDKILYVGKSEGVGARIRDHEKEKVFDRAFYVDVGTFRMEYVEGTLQRHFRPPLCKAYSYVPRADQVHILEWLGLAGANVYRLPSDRDNEWGAGR